jgi:NAD(P)-dependent dehydrogenase (short-subunit alcohol dehydrogenase family)
MTTLRYDDSRSTGHSGAAVALVTGANRGLGQETARQLADRGMIVVLASRDPDNASTAAGLAAAGSAARPVRLDVTDAGTVRAAAAEIEASYGRLDVLVNNAGVWVAASAAYTDGSLLRQVIDVNLIGVANVIHAFLPLLRRSAAPRIVNVSSTAASLALTAGNPDVDPDPESQLAYSTSKAALNMLTVQYAAAFSRDPELRHIKINAASPGYVATDMTQYRGTRTVEDGAGIIVQLAALPDEGPTGGFFNDHGSLPW